MALRKIIEIDEEKCNGCGQCVDACAEGALQLINGKAKLVGEIYCDGLGACIGDCPEGAITIIEREAEEFDEAAVERLLENKAAEETKPEEKLACGCPSSQTMTLDTAGCGRADASADAASQLSHWPIKLQLLSPDAPYIKGADLVLLADCGAASHPNLHRDIIKGRVIAMGCPKLDDLDAHITKLADILKSARPRSLTVLYMEVPCCKGFIHGAKKAIEIAGVEMPLKTIMIGRTGEILKEESVGCDSCHAKG